MKNYVHLSYGDTSYGRHLVDDVATDPDAETWFIDLARIPSFPNPQQPRRRRRRRTGGPLEQFFDPKREHPFLKSLFQAAAPIIQAYISGQLPGLLGSLTAAIEDPDDAAD